MRLVSLLAALLLVGCALEPATKVEVPPLVALPMTTELAQIASEAKTCDRPAVAISKVSAGFRYGCFCGAGYPDLHHPSGKPDQALSQAERAELAVRYLSIKPIDDIDAICQAHDVCWVLNGDGKLECNEGLEESLKTFRRAVEKGHEFDSESLQFRCGWLALDIEYASLSVMQSASADPVKDTALAVARVLTSPLTVGYALITQIKRGFDPFPRSSERCSLHELARKTGRTET